MAQDKIDLIMRAATNNPSANRHEACKYFGLNNINCYENVVLEGLHTKKRKDNTYEIARACVDEWAHDDTCTRIDTNQFKFKTVDDEKHPIRTWNTMHWFKSLEKFHESEIYAKYKSLHPSLTIGNT